MRDERIGYVVCEISQASGRVTDTLPSQVLHSDRADAEFERDLHADETAEAGRHDRYIVCEVIPVESDDDD